MTARDRLAVAGAVAVALAAAALFPVFGDASWLLRVLGAVVAVVGAATLMRRAGAPRALEPLGGLLGLAAYVCVVFAGSTLSFVVVPSQDTLALLGDRIGEGLLDVEEYAPPVPVAPGLVLLAVLGVGAIAVVVDALAVTARRPALAGLPLLLLFAVPAAVLPDGLGWLPFALGAAGWLGLLLADGRDAVSRWGAPLRSAGRGPVTSDPSLGRVGRRIGAAALGVAIVVPAVIPGLDNRLLGGGGDGGGFGGGSRTTTTYNPILELGGQLRRPEPGVLLMRYRTDAAQPDYLRLTTLDLFDSNAGWSSSQLRADLQDDAVQDGIPDPRDASFAPVEQVSTTIDLARIDGPWLPAPFPPSRVDIDGPWLWEDRSETIFSTRTSLREIDAPYTVEAGRRAPDPALLRAAPGAPTDIVETYGVEPELTAFVADLLARVVDGKTTDYDRVVAIQDYLRSRANGFRYSENADVPGFNQPNALERFLRAKQGFCEQYASAMAALVRGLGIPARVAVGFTPGTREPDGGWRVTTSDAHAWPEVFFSGAGWIRFEPTPRAEQVTVPGYTQPPADVPETDGPDPSAAPVPSATTSAAPANPNAVDRGDDIAGAGGAGPGGLSRGALATLVGGGLAVLLLVLPTALTWLRRRRRWSVPGPLVAWSQVRDDAVDVGHRWRPADSPRTAARHLAAARRLPGTVVEALDELAIGAERARYARPDGSPVDVAALDEAVRVVRAGLQAGVDRRQRWIARVAPPSTLRWASHGLGDATADVLDRFDALVSAVGERMRHPRELLRRT
ncbi:MAG: transglutaminase domain-containing protein [Frankiales bacterium]|nr:MAG: transglutaminase domain-containing protein [Frankiales bacterium]